MNSKVMAALIFAGMGTTLYHVSNWWERALATYKSSELSPDGCFRIDAYEPFRVIPSLFHRIPHPDPSTRNDLFIDWELPVFKRAYEVSSGGFLGQTVVYDAAYAYDIDLWNESDQPGRRVVKVDGFTLFDSDRCADAETLAKLAVGIEQREEALRLMREGWAEEDRKRAIEVSDQNP